MSRSSNIFIGLFTSFAVSCVATVLLPQAQLGTLQPRYTEDEGKITDVYPIDVNGIAAQGRQVYVSEGCINCHTQQVRDEHMGTDIERGWGPRRTVARDYIYSNPALLGIRRVGPDLTNIGWNDWRNEAKGDPRRPAKRDSSWFYRFLYSPESVLTESNHPPYRYLFEERKLSGARPNDALNIIGKDMPGEGRAVIPTFEARALVGYLLSLDRSAELPEAKLTPASASVAASSGGTAPAPAAQ